MGAFLSFLYGLVAYGASLAALLYLIGFSGNGLVPKSVDSGAFAPLAKALCVNILLLGLFAAQHSVMARRAFKRWWTRIVPPVVERSTYVLAASIALALLFWLWLPIPVPIIWRIDNPAAAQLLWAAFWLGWVLVLVSTFLINHFELFGLQQAWLNMSGRQAAAPELRQPMFYRWVAHPLYAGFFLGFWSTPRMTVGHVLLAGGVSIYMLIAIRYEERDLTDLFGEDYRRYRASVGGLVPRFRR